MKKMVPLTTPNFSGTTLTNTNFSGTTVELSLGRNFVGTTFDNKTTFVLPKIERKNLDQYLNHLNNLESGSLLTVINTIPDPEAKIRAMCALLANLPWKAPELALHANAMIDILCGNPVYSQNTRIRNYIVQITLKTPVVELQQ